MKISFLCPSAEPGRDGVGDYVVRFARALSALGHRCQVIAMADRHTNGVRIEEAAHESFELIRIPASLWHSGDTRIAASALQRFKPDWTSLQMVCYGYENRGLLLRSARRFKDFRVSGRRHIMFHELWIGESIACPPRDRAVGWMQKRLVLRALRAWDPHLIHTSNPLYRELLRRNGVSALELPLPSNIPVIPPQPGLDPRAWALELLHLPESPGARPFLAALFGSIHPGLAEQPWLPELATTCREIGRELILLQLGRAGPAGMTNWSHLRDRHGRGVRFVELGEKPPAELSQWLQAIDLGLSTTPWSILGKSSAVSTMVEHGVPVVAVKAGADLRGGPTPEPDRHDRLHRFDSRFLDHLRRGRIARQMPCDSVVVFQRFAGSLASGAVPGPQL